MISSKNIIFVGGIHGVGKSTICKKLCNDLGIEYLSASKLINDYKNKLLRENHDVGKFVEDISQNQDVLVRAVNECIEQDEKYLLDGHFTLLDSSGSVQVIPLSTFADLSLAGIVVLTDDPVSIQKKLLSRDDKQFDLGLLASMQGQELSHAEYVGIMLKLKVDEISTDNYGNMKSIIAESL